MITVKEIKEKAPEADVVALSTEAKYIICIDPSMVPLAGRHYLATSLMELGIAAVIMPCREGDIRIFEVVP